MVTTMTYKGVQIGDSVNLAVPNIKRMTEPEIQVGVFKSKAEALELGANAFFEDRFRIDFHPSETRTMWTIRNAVKDWLTLFGNTPGRLIVSGDDISIDEPYAILAGIDRIDSPDNIVLASLASFWFTFYYRDEA